MKSVKVFRTKNIILQCFHSNSSYIEKSESKKNHFRNLFRYYSLSILNGCVLGRETYFVEIVWKNDWQVVQPEKALKNKPPSFFYVRSYIECTPQVFPGQGRNHYTLYAKFLLDAFKTRLFGIFCLKDKVFLRSFFTQNVLLQLGSACSTKFVA